jgi:hypothetical protein
MEFRSFIEKHYCALENAFDFTYYLELYDRFKLGRDQDHKTMIDAFLRFVGKKDVTVLKMDNDVISDIVDVSRDELMSNLYLLGDETGLFFDEDWDVSYAFAGEGFFAYILPHMLMFSSEKENCEMMADVLDEFSLKHTTPALRPDIDTAEKPTRFIQLKISLKGVKPIIWRRVVVPDDISYREFHNIIQLVMGWENYHMYQFLINDITIEGEGESGFSVDSVWKVFHSKDESNTFWSGDVTVGDLITDEKQEFEYVYDLGDNWVHKIVVEKIRSEGEPFPIVLDGEQNGPPEDCGGVYGYQELLEIRKDPDHELYEDRIVDWLGEDFDPELFDKQNINSRLNDMRNWQEKSLDDSYHSDIKMRKLGRNEPCYCGSGKKYKKCCLLKDMEEFGRQRKVPV